MTTLFPKTPSNWYNQYKTHPFIIEKSTQTTPKQFYKEEREIAMTMDDWAKHLDNILTMSGEQLLQGNGLISAKQAMEKAEAEYKKYKARTLSDVEKDYLDSIKLLGSKSKP